MNDKQKNDVTALFEQSDIPRHWWHTKYGYFLLYRESRFFLALFAQLIFVIALLFGSVNLIQVYALERTGLTSIIVTSFFVASIANGISELLIYNFKEGFYWLGISAAFYFVVYQFYA